MRFATKLTMLFSGTVLAISIMISYLVYTSNLKTLDELIRDKMEEQAFHTMDKIDRMLFERYSDLKLLASDPVIRSRTSTPAQIEERLKDFRAHTRSYASLSFFDLNRNRIADTAGRSVGEQHPLITYWRELEKGNDFVMDVSRSVSLNEVIFHYAHIVKDDNGAPFGVVVSRMPVENMYDIVNQAAGFKKVTTEEGLEVDLVNKDGLVLYSNYNKKGIMKDTSPDWEMAKKFIYAGKRIGSEWHTHPSGHPEGEELYAFAREQGYLDFKGNGWILILNIPTKVAFAPAIELRDRIIMVLFAMSAFALIVITVFSRTVTRPIGILSKASLEIGEGELDTRVKIKSGDELGLLASSFNSMAENLKRSRDEIVSTNEYISNVLHSMYDSLIVISLDGFIKTLNRATLALLGYREDELPGQHISCIFGKGNSPFSSVEIEALIEIGHITNIEKWFLTKDGRKIPVLFSASVMRDRDRRIQGVVCVALDNTEQKMAQEALRASEERYRTLFEESKDGVVMGTFDGGVLDINPAGVEIFGYSSKYAFMKANIADLFNDRTLWDRFKGDIRKHGFVKDFEAVLKTSAGTLVIVNMTANLVHDEEGKAAAFRGIIRDITAHKKLEQQLIQSQKMEAIGEFTGKIAHDFKNILTVISVNGNIIKTRTKGDETLSACTELIIGSSKRAANLIQGLLAFSRNQMVCLKPVNLNKVVEDVESLIQSLLGEDILFKTALSAEKLSVMADSGQIEQVLINLATNARDAMPNGGAMTISTELMEWSSGNASNGRIKPAEYALITVTDTGVGMDEKTQERIFEPFFTTKAARKGTGLGLSIVYGIVEQHNGYINVASEPGAGTTFQIFLPAVKLEEEAAKESTALLPPPTGTETILLAEDDEGVRYTTRRIFEESGYKVIEAENGADAVDKFMENQAAVQMLVLDVMMPRKNGKQAYDEIKKIASGVKAVFISAYTDDILDKKWIFEERLNLVSKPFSREELLFRVREALDS